MAFPAGPSDEPATGSGPERRNPIYLGMFLGLIGLAIAFANLCLLMMLVPFALVIRSRDSHLHRLLGARPITASRTL